MRRNLWSQQAKRVAPAEVRSVVGGLCTNTGTIPGKTLREALLHFSGYKVRSIDALNYHGKGKVTISDLTLREQPARGRPR